MPTFISYKPNFLEVALCLLLMFAGISILVSVQLFLHIPLYFCVGLIAGIISPLFFVLKKDICLWSYLAALVIFMICTLVAGLLYDFSWDGQTYHQLAQIMLAKGWNPYWSPEKIGVYSHDIWVNAYPKSIWVYAGSIYAVTGNILMGKGYYFYVVLATFVLCYKVFKLNFKSRKLSVLFSVLLTFNPVVCCQMLTYYLDAAVYLLIVDFMALSYLIMKNQLKQKSMPLTIIFGIIVVICNTKFTSVLYIIILCITELAIIISIKDKKLFKQFFFLYIAAGIFGVCFIGFNPYITNILRHGNVGWPIIGKGKIDIVNTQIYPKFAAKDRFTKFFLSYNGQSVNNKDGEPRLKFPGCVNIDELKTLVGPETRFGGFGPWFNLVMLLSTLGIILLIAKRKLPPPLLIILIGLLVSVFANPECWWARYVPQLYIVPVLVASWGLKDEKVKKIFEALTIALFINICFVVSCQPYIYMKQMHLQSKLNNKLKSAYKKTHQPMYVDFKGFYSRTASLMELNNIPYIYFDSEHDILPQGYRCLFCKDYGLEIYVKE